MSRSSASPWYRARAFGEEWVGEVFVTLSPSYIRLHLRDMEAYKTPALWVTNADWLVGYDAICKQGASLLMDATDRIVQEIRAMREGSGTPAEYRDPQFFSYDMPLASLATVTSNLRRGGESIADIMFDIRTLIEQGNASEEQQELALEAIKAIIVGLV